MQHGAVLQAICCIHVAARMIAVSPVNDGAQHLTESWFEVPHVAVNGIWDITLTHCQCQTISTASDCTSVKEGHQLGVTGHWLEAVGSFGKTHSKRFRLT